ncbi:hypothetical protein BJF93_13340 [Xaviernesmea oryzae]|uniref:Cyclic di-GMP-binding protein n=2 Tax=Xaviernesmea oryzae TaxID=464029 RepID=A0A1Q9ARF0_9HYPH|nr:hypothetical protein BJF93_13340 [Xaviernesmea oryzae]
MSGERKPDAKPAAKAFVAPAPAAPVLDPRGTRRPFLPQGTLRLAGEQDQRSFTVTLTAEQAAAANSITLAYQNAIVVAPENSRLSLSINNVQVGDTPIAAPEGVVNLALPLPAGLMQAGPNIVTLTGTQRHRTDCTVQSTFDLWTDIQPDQSFIGFSTPVAGRLLRLEDLAAVSPDQTGHTKITIVAPALGNPSRADGLMRVAQGLALRMGGQAFTVQSALPRSQGAGGLTVLLGTQSELAKLAPGLPPEAATAPTLAFMPLPESPASALVVSGPTPQAVQAATERLATQAQSEGERHSLSTASWRLPNAPVITGKTALPLSRLGIATTEFSGRRLRTDFTVGLPYDFYASAYGEAELLLDAAYAANVLPGSRINIYVNGNIATTAPLTTQGGGLLRHVPIRVTMRHFVPGLNTVAIEAVLLTDQDDVCSTGTPAQTTPRFALFDTSEFRMPDFGRAANWPNLAATAGMGAPYGETQPRPTALYVDRPSPETLSAAATLVGQLSAAAGHAFPVETVGAANALEGRDALVVGALPQLPPPLVAQMGLAPAAGTAWAGGKAQPTDGTANAIDSWRGKVSNGSWMDRAETVDGWLRRNFDLSLASLAVLPREDLRYQPPGAADILLAQMEAPDGKGTWTLATAPTPAALEKGLSTLIEPGTWSRVNGRIAAYDSRRALMETVAPRKVVLASTQPFSITGWRLIAANWMSTNILSFALLFLVAFAALGLITTLLLRGVGRRH